MQNETDTLIVLGVKVDTLAVELTLIAMLKARSDAEVKSILIDSILYQKTLCWAGFYPVRTKALAKILTTYTMDIPATGTNSVDYLVEWLSLFPTPYQMVIADANMFASRLLDDGVVQYHHHVQEMLSLK